MVGFLISSCAKEGQLAIVAPKIQKQSTIKESRSSCEIDADRLKDDLKTCRDAMFDLKYDNQCWSNYGDEEL
jgi:hypothetical protein